MKPRLLDLFCGAGGATRGYQAAGFHVTGVDIAPQPNYIGDDFHQADAMTFPLDGYDAIHASPPCPRYSAGTPQGYRDRHPDLIYPVRRVLADSGLPWVIENVAGSPVYAIVVLCGSMFGMRVRRHRLFEMSLMMLQPECRHREQGTPLSVTGSGYGGKHKGHNGTKPSGIVEGREVMGIDWPMTIRELSNAIPPAYTQWIGEQLLAALEAAA